MRSLSFILLFLLGYQALAQGMLGQAGRLIEKQNRCYSLLVNEFQNALAKDNGLIQAQLTLTGMKLAKQAALARKDDAGLSNLKKYAEVAVNDDFVKRLNEDSKTLERITEMYRTYRSKSQAVLMPRIEVFQSLGMLLNSEEVNDKEAGSLITSLMHFENDSVFDENDLAVAWFVNQASRNFDGKDSHYLAQITSAALKGSDKFVADNIAKAQLKLKAALAKIKEKVFEANREYCLSDYRTGYNGQNRSVFLSCRPPEEEILNQAFLRGIQNILQNAEQPAYKTRLALESGKERKLDSNQIRAVQDHLNSEKYSDKQRIIEYYKRGVYPDDGSCQTFTMVDKKSQTTSVYTVDGEEIFTTNSIQARPREGDEGVVFNPDSELRKFDNGTYTRTTSAGVFYSILDMDPAERKRRKYDEEFDDRVFVIGPREYKNGEYFYDDQTTIALHGVPINGWVDNANERLDSFEGGNRNLSTGCVNMEAYAFDLMNGLSQNHCPVYILPEDEKNYFHVKNREISFSTSDPARKEGGEPARKCRGGRVVLEQGQARCEGGEWVDDPNNENRYYFSPLSRESSHVDVEVKGERPSETARILFADRERLINQVAANNIDAEDFEDLVALTHATAPDAENIEARFKDLYNSYYALREYRGVNFDLVPMDEKRRLIIEYYQDPEGFEKLRRQAGKNIYAPVDRDQKPGEVLEEARKVRFVHDR